MSIGDVFAHLKFTYSFVGFNERSAYIFFHIFQPYELETKVLTNEYLAEIERCYKEEYLPSIKDTVEVVHYDWSTFGDINHVVEDLERLPLDEMMDNRWSKKFEDWKGHQPRDWDQFRME